MTRHDDQHRHRYSVVDAYGRLWGWAWRQNFGDLAEFPVPSLAGKLIEQGHGAAGGQHKPRSYPEVFRGQALEFANALKQVPERHRDFAWVHYVVDLPAKAKAPLLGIHVQTYWQRRRSMQSALAESLGM